MKQQIWVLGALCAILGAAGLFAQGSSPLVASWTSDRVLTVAWTATVPACLYLDQVRVDAPCGIHGAAELVLGGQDVQYTPYAGRTLRLVQNGTQAVLGTLPVPYHEPTPTTGRSGRQILPIIQTP